MAEAQAHLARRAKMGNRVRRGSEEPRVQLDGALAASHLLERAEAEAWAQESGDRARRFFQDATEQNIGRLGHPGHPGGGPGHVSPFFTLRHLLVAASRAKALENLSIE